MFVTPDVPWLKRQTLAFIVTIVLVMAAVFIAMRTTPETTTIPFERLGIPLPFTGINGESSNLTGMVSYYGKRNGFDVYEVTFKNGEKRETFMPDRIYLVHIPNDETIVNGALDNVITSLSISSHQVNFYGYKYSDAAATMERRDIYAVRFIDRFPGPFFASQAARDDDYRHGNMLLAFEKATKTTFLKTDASFGTPRLDNGGSLFVFVVNEPGGAFFSPYEHGTCGNATTEGAEECDDGNTNNADMCKNDCTQGIPIPFGSGSSMTGAKLAITQQPMVSSKIAVATETGINLLTFQASASTEDINLKTLLFAAATGSLSSVRNVTLWKDTDNDNKVDALVHTFASPQSGILSFSGSEMIPERQTYTYEVHADVAGTPSIVSLRLATLETEYVAGERAATNVPLVGIRTNGDCDVLVCQIIVTTLKTTVWILLPTDPTRLTVETLATSPETGTLVRGSTGAVFEASAMSHGEDIQVRTLVFKAATGSVTDMTFSLWVDDFQGGLTQKTITPVVDAVSRTITFHSGSGLFIVPGAVSSGSRFQLRALPLPMSRHYFKVTFSLSTPEYIRARSSDVSSPNPDLVGIRSNAFCNGVVCEIHVIENPTTLWSVTGAPVCGNEIREGQEECDDGNTILDDECDTTCHLTTPIPRF